MKTVFWVTLYVVGFFLMMGWSYYNRCHPSVTDYSHMDRYRARMGCAMISGVLWPITVPGHFSFKIFEKE